jgi:hypothetical protein
LEVILSKRVQLTQRHPSIAPLKNCVILPALRNEGSKRLSRREGPCLDLLHLPLFVSPRACGKGRWREIFSCSSRAVRTLTNCVILSGAPYAKSKDLASIFCLCLSVILSLPAVEGGAVLQVFLRAEIARLAFRAAAPKDPA